MSDPRNSASAPFSTSGPILTTTSANPPSTRMYTTVATVSGSEMFSIVTETSLVPTTFAGSTGTGGGTDPRTGAEDGNGGGNGGTSSGTASGVEGGTTSNSIPGNSFNLGLASGMEVRVGIVASGLALGFVVAL